MKHHFTHFVAIPALLACSLFSLSAQDADYYKQAFGKRDAELKTTLSTIISDAGIVTYDKLFQLYESTDVRPDGKVWDIYSDQTDFVFGIDKCGNYQKEGDCYNREHSIPKSWFNSASPMYSDGWHVIPTDGYVNNRRDNYPFGEVATPTYTSLNGFSKLGKAGNPGYSGIVFEPNDAYKGDIARILFYMATRYEGSCGNWSAGIFASEYPHLSPWVVELLLKWHRQDPVSTKESDRNKAMHRSEQGNRNPYIDYPELAELIFGNRKGETFNPTSPDEKEFKALPASQITQNSFQANWIKHPEAADYLIDVYTKSSDNGNTQSLSLKGYPLHTGDTDVHTITSLAPASTYYYRLSPIINGMEGNPSAEISTTTAGDTYIPKQQEDEVISFLSGNSLNLLNVPAGASISLYNLSGQLVLREKGIQQEECFRIGEKGIYLLHINGRTVNIIRRIVVE